MCFAMVALLLAAPSASQSLRSLLELEWRWRLSEFPLWATGVGAHERDAELDRVDPASWQRRLEHWRAVAGELEALPRDPLSASERVDAAVLAEQVRASIAEIEQRAHLVPVNGDSGFYSDLPQLPRAHRFRDAADYRLYLRRLREVPRYFEENLALMREGLRVGMTPPQVTLRGREKAAQAQLVEPRRSDFFRPFDKLPPSISPEEAARLRAEGEAALREAVLPAYAGVARFLVETYQPGARQGIAASELPGGPAFYRSRIRQFVTRDVAPEELHAIGLREVARIRAGMEAVRREAGFAGGLPAFLQHLRSAPEQHASTAEELLMRASFVAKRIDGELPRFFGLLPRLPYRVEAVPDAIAPFYTGGRYVPAAEGSVEPGTFWVNTWDLKSRPLFVLPALALHEAVPGHHLQAALAAEQTGLSPLRRSAEFAVYVEGWALYAERLGEEMGIYRTPTERFGRLTYEMWRACRLVVDTGMHALGWSRERALAYLTDNTALSAHEIETEIDRYLAWPAQALAYKMGELALLDLRARAEQALGPRFDLRRFHDAVLALGPVPLPVLEAELGRAIASGALARPAREEPAEATGGRP